MKIYSIKDKTVGNNPLGYFIVYEKTGDCCIELCEKVDEWDLPFILDYYAHNGEYSIGKQDTMKFIQQRIIPPDRQNIGSILRDNGLEEYDEIKLFIISDGRCAQDECYIRKIRYDDIPESIKIRMKHYIESVSLNENNDYIISFYDGKVGVLDSNNDELLKNKYYSRIKSQATRLEIGTKGLGNYITIGEYDCISAEKAYRLCSKLSLTMSDLRKLVLKSIMSTQDVMDTLECTRQNVNDLVKRGKLTPIEANNRNMIFSKAEVLKRMY